MIRLTQLRLDALLTVEELAERAKVPVGTIYNVERGDVKRPRIDTLRKLAEFFNVPASELLAPAVRKDAA